MFNFLNPIKKSFDSLRSLRMTLNESGVIHLIPLLLILAGIAGGVYLVQKEGFQIFKPKAGGYHVEWIKSEGDPDNCIVSVDGNTATANCSKIKLRLNPPDPNQTSDASFQLVKTAYANHPPDTEDWYCRNWPNYSSYSSLKYSKSEVWHSKKYKAEDMNDWWEQAGDNMAQTFGEGLHSRYKTCDVVKGEVCKTFPNWSEERGNFQDADCFPADEEPIGRQQEEPATSNKSSSESQGEAQPDDLDKRTISWYCGIDNKIWRQYITTEGKIDSVLHEDCGAQNLKCEQYYNEENPSVTKWDARCVAKTAESSGTGTQDQGSSQQEDSGQPKTGDTALQPPAPRGLTPSAGQAPGSVTQPAAGRPTAGQNPGVQIPGGGKQPAGGTQVPGSQTTCKRGETPKTGQAYMDTTQADCVLNWNKNILPTYVNGGWCGDDANKQAIANHWYANLASPAETNEVSAKCLGAQQSKEVRKVVKYKLAVSSPLLFNKEEWKDITTDPIALNIPGLTTGRQSIFVQFQDNKGQTVKINGLDWATAYVIFTTPTIVPQKDQPATPDNAAKEDCPVENYMNYSIDVLRQKCSTRQLSRLPMETLSTFSNQDLLVMAKDLNGENGPYIFLDQFDNDRLSSFDLGTLKKLPEGRINMLPDNLKNLIKGTGSASSDQASCSSVSVSGSSIKVNFTGTAQSLKIWLASNREAGKQASEVGSWSQVGYTFPNPTSGSAYVIDTSGFAKGTHAVLVSLYDSAGQMLDGNPNLIVNSACASSINIP